MFDGPCDLKQVVKGNTSRFRIHLSNGNTYVFSNKGGHSYTINDSFGGSWPVTFVDHGNRCVPLCQLQAGGHAEQRQPRNPPQEVAGAAIGAMLENLFPLIACDPSAASHLAPAICLRGLLTVIRLPLPPISSSSMEWWPLIASAGLSHPPSPGDRWSAADGREAEDRAFAVGEIEPEAVVCCGLGSAAEAMPLSVQASGQVGLS